MAAKDGRIVVDGLRPLLRLMSDLPKETQAEIRVKAQRIVEPVAAEARRNASSAQQRLVAPSIRAVKDRVPKIKAGGSKTLASTTPRRRKPKAGDVFFGANFGGAPRQFPPKVKPDYMLFRAVEGNRRHIAKQYLDAVERAFGNGPLRGN